MKTDSTDNKVQLSSGWLFPDWTVDEIRAKAQAAAQRLIAAFKPDQPSNSANYEKASD